MTETAALPSSGFRRNRFFCSFCERPLTEVAFVITGPRAAICDECLAASAAKAAEWHAEQAKTSGPSR